LADLIASGARILECTCGPCIGQGNAPPSNSVSVRTFNRNFEGRSGTKDAELYLTSVETAVATAIKGKLTDPRGLGEIPVIPEPSNLHLDDSLVIYPPKNGDEVKIIRGPNIAALPIKDALSDTLKGKVLIKVEDNITTDHIMPAGKYLPLRSNVPEYAKHVFEQVDSDFHDKAKALGGGFIVGGENYGQGSSREHAALCPMYLDIRVVIVKSFARIHLANLINFGILPLTFADPSDYDNIDQLDELELDVSDFDSELLLVNKTKDIKIKLTHTLSSKDIEILKAGGMLNYSRAHI